MPSQVRFGVLLPTKSKSFDLSLEVALTAEKRGFDSVWAVDHFMPTERSYRLTGIDPTLDILEAWPVLAALAALTKRVKIGTSVSPIPAYNPAILAKIAATIDIISNGRLIFGAGVGYHEVEFKAYNLPWEDFKERTQRTREGLEIIKRLWTEQTTTYEGKYFKTVRAVSNPKPIQKPRPPIWLGGESKRTMRMIAELGDGWLPAVLSPEDYQQKILELEIMTKQHGRSLEDIELGYYPVTNVSLKADEAIKTSKMLILAGEEQADVDIEKRLRWGVHGSPEMAVEQLQAFIDIGVKHFVFYIIPQKNTVNCLRLLRDEVIPRLR